MQRLIGGVPAPYNMALTSLKDKQEYYKYPSAGGWKFKTPPELNPEVARAMKREGLDSEYRFVWMGCDIEREREDDPHGIVHGDINSTKYVMRRLFKVENSVMVPYQVAWREPKKMYVRTRQPEAWCFRNAANELVRTTRRDLAPDGVIGWWEFRYHDLGILSWWIEQRVNGVWEWIETIRSKERLYAEPSLLHVQDLVKRRWEDRNKSEKEIREIAQREEAEREQLRIEAAKANEQLGRQMVNELVATHLDYAERQPHSVLRP